MTVKSVAEKAEPKAAPRPPALIAAQGEAALVAVVCALCSVVTGFVLYIVFVHTFEAGEFWTRLISFALAIAVALGVARLGEWLWDTISETQPHDSTADPKSDQGKRVLSTAIFLLVTFELCSSAIQDFTKLAVGDFASVQAIAGRIAGRNYQSAQLTDGNADLNGLYDRLRGHVRDKGLPAPGAGAASPEARLIQLMSLEQRLVLFAREYDPTGQELAGLANPTLISTPLGLRPLETPLRPVVPVADCWPNNNPGMAWRYFDSPLLPRNEAERAQLEAAKIERARAAEARRQACIQGLRSLEPENRMGWFRGAINDLLVRPDLYQSGAFGTGTGSQAPAALREALTNQAQICADILAAATAARTATSKLVAGPILNCRQAAARNPAIAKTHPGLAAPSQMRAWNRQLLEAQFPAFVTPLPANWWDFLVMGLVWCAGAGALGVFLSQSVFAVDAKDGVLGRLLPSAMAALFGLLATAVAAGLAVLAVRLIEFLGAMMFGEIPVPPSEIKGIVSMIYLVPEAVRFLKEIDIYGFSIPGWLSLPALVIILGAIALSGGGDTNIIQIGAGLALLGLAGFAILPVLPGIFVMMAVVALSWLIPALGLALLLPYLEPGAKVPKLWGWIALAAGLALGIWAFLIRTDSDILTELLLSTSALTLLATGILIFRDVAVRDLWPLLTVTVAVCLVGGTSFWHEATFKGSLDLMQQIRQEAAPAAEPSTLGYLVFGEDALQDNTAAVTLLDDGAGVREAARLELALVGSLGFWLTIAILAAWALRRKAEAQEKPPAPDLIAPQSHAQ